MTAFFIPGVANDPSGVEGAYRDMSGVIELEMGRRPNPRRILRLWTRRGSTGCVTEVGSSDPLRGGMVIAIFDMGLHQPFVVWWQPDGGTPAGVREILGPSAYAVLEFDSWLEQRARAGAGRRALLPRPGGAPARQVVQVGPGSDPSPEELERAQRAEQRLSDARSREVR